MTLVLSPRFPPLLGWALLVLLIDLAVSILIVSGDQGPGVFMLFQLAGWFSWMGGVEAVTWISQDSPWAKRRREPRNLDELREALYRELEPAPKGYVAKRMALLRSWDLVGWRAFSLRLMSGAALLFTLGTLFLFFVGPMLPEKLAFLQLWVVLTWIRLLPFSCAGVFLAPLLLVALPKHRPTAGEFFHAGMTFFSAGSALALLWTANQPPILDFILAVAHAGSNLFAWPYGIMLGGLVWFLASTFTTQGTE